MKQILQDLSSGKTLLENVPIPNVVEKGILIKTRKSLLSSGTEKMLIDFGKSNYVEKAMQQPEKVKEVINKVKTDGLANTFNAVQNKLNQPLPLGYCNVGIVDETKSRAFQKGDRVVSNGYHAEYVSIPQNLAAKIPENVDDDSASFTVLGAVALQGIRLLNLTVGEKVVVFGLGLIGLLSVQILRAQGYRVMGVDYNSERCKLAEKFGAEIVNLSKNDLESKVSKFTNGIGVDAVLITANTRKSEVISQSAKVSRKRGRLVLVGVTGLDLKRDDFYEKELTFQVSCSYGPGRYDKNYEISGNDYPLEFVRWTAQRNFESFLDLIAQEKIDPKSLISCKFSFDQSVRAYQEIYDPNNLGIILEYGEEERKNKATSLSYAKHNIKTKEEPNVAFIGGGNYASSVLIPSFKKAGASLHTIVTSQGISAAHNAKRYGFENASTNFEDALVDDVDALIISTRHNLHAEQIIRGLEAGKHIFVEKPVALNTQDLDRIRKAENNSNSILMVGFNRRFSPLTKYAQKLLVQKDSPKSFIFTMNSGSIPSSHWVHDKSIGGGRIVGEACHYIDLMLHLAGAKISTYDAKHLIDKNLINLNDVSTINMSFEDGSIGSINYYSNGSKSFPKERLEIFCDGSILQIDNFRKIKCFDWPGAKDKSYFSQDKGQINCSKEFINCIRRAKPSPISFEEIYEVGKISVEMQK